VGPTVGPGVGFGLGVGTGVAGVQGGATNQSPTGSTLQSWSKFNAQMSAQSSPPPKRARMDDGVSPFTTITLLQSGSIGLTLEVFVYPRVPGAVRSQLLRLPSMHAGPVTYHPSSFGFPPPP